MLRESLAEGAFKGGPPLEFPPGGEGEVVGGCGVEGPHPMVNYLLGSLWQRLLKDCSKFECQGHF